MAIRLLSLLLRSHCEKTRLFSDAKAWQPSKNTDQGLTLLELIIVMVMASVLALLSFPTLMAQTGKARDSEAKNALSAIAAAQQVHFFQEGSFADKLEKLSATVDTHYYEFPDPTINATGLAVKQQASALNAGGNSIHNYSMGIYYVDQRFGLVLCQSSRIAETVDAPDSYTDNCTNGQKLE